MRTAPLLALALALSLSACVQSKTRPDDGGQVAPKDSGATTKKDASATTKKDTGGTPKEDTGGVPVKVPGTWVKVTAGGFWMGKRDDESCTFGSSERRHHVTLTRSFVLSQYEVTQAQFSSVMGYNPSEFKGTDKTKGSTYCGQSSCGNNPADAMTWHEAAAYCNALSAMAKFPPCYDCSGSGRTISCVVAAFPKRQSAEVTTILFTHFVFTLSRAESRAVVPALSPPPKSAALTCSFTLRAVVMIPAFSLSV